MTSLGWHDPIWKQLYGPTPAAPEQPAQADTAEAPVMDYLSQIQQAAASGQSLNFSDLPGYQTNLTMPEA